MREKRIIRREFFSSCFSFFFFLGYELQVSFVSNSLSYFEGEILEKCSSRFLFFYECKNFYSQHSVIFNV